MRRPWVRIAIVLFLLAGGVLGYRVYRSHRNASRLRELSELLELELLEYEKQSWTFGTAFGESRPGNFLEPLAKIETLSDALWEKLESEGEDAIEADEKAGEVWYSPLPEPLPADVIDWVVRREPMIARALEAARCDTAGPWTDIRHGFDESEDDAFFPARWVMSARDYIRLDAIRMAEAGRPDDAVDRLLALDQLGARLQPGAPAIRWIVGEAARSDVCRDALRLVARGLLGAEARQRLVPMATARLAERLDFAGHVAAERLELQVCLRVLAAGKLDWYEDRNPFPFDLPSGLSGLFEPPASHWLDIWEHVRAWAPRLEAAARDGPGAYDIEWGRMCDDDATSQLANFLQTLGIVASRDREGRQWSQALLLALRLRGIHERTGAWPESLDGLNAPDLGDRKWVYGIDPETKLPVLNLDPHPDDGGEEPEAVFRVR